MHKRHEIIRALRAEGWRYVARVNNALMFSNGSDSIKLYPDSMDYGFVPKFGTQRVWVGWELANIRVDGITLFLPEMEGTGPYCA